MYGTRMVGQIWIAQCTILGIDQPIFIFEFNSRQKNRRQVDDVICLQPDRITDWIKSLCTPQVFLVKSEDFENATNIDFGRFLAISELSA